MVIKYVHKYAVVCSLLWAIFIFVLCATPGRYIPTASWLDLLSFDKFVHASVFFVQTWFLCEVARKYRQPKIFLPLYTGLAVLYGISLEIMQARFFSERSADWKDVVANSFGCVLAFFLFRKRVMAV